MARIASYASGHAHIETWADAAAYVKRANSAALPDFPAAPTLLVYGEITDVGAPAADSRRAWR